MPTLTRRPHPERPDCWRVYYGDVQGTLAIQAGMPLSAPQWRWDVGFYPVSHRGKSRLGYASSFEQARSGFEAAWNDYLPQCSDADFTEYRRERASTAPALLLRHSNGPGEKLVGRDPSRIPTFQGRPAK
jgi:hypothetical protein